MRIKLTTTLFALTLTACPGIVLAQPVMDDTQIENAVERELLYDRAVPQNNIDVRIADGIVTLAGSVDNLLAQKRATRIAETVRGVRAVINRITVDPPLLRSDREIQEDIRAALLADPATDSYEVDVRVRDRHAKLSGRVDSWREKQLCATVAMGVSGVTELTNDIEVRYSVDRVDSEITQEIDQALAWSVLVDDGLIEVETTDGKVKLSGIVGSAAERHKAIEIAWVIGVSSVDATDLRIEHWARDPQLRTQKYTPKSDAEIRKAVEDALLYDPRVNSFDVRTEVSSRMVTLKGAVDNLSAKRAAERDAHNTVGVFSVQNHIKVRPEEARRDAAVAEDVRRALRRDPFVDRHEISVSVQNGIVELTGIADSHFEKAQADEIASRVNGVLAVDNDLIVDFDGYAYDPYVDDWRFNDFTWYDTWAPTYALDSDQEIKRAIETELWWSPFVDDDQVHVKSEDGIVTLTGTVGSNRERMAAEQNAYEGGAVYVRNRLEIELGSENH